MAYDAANEILIGQWRDNKVVQFVSSTNEGGLGVVKRRIGSQRVDFQCPHALIQYQKTCLGLIKEIKCAPMEVDSQTRSTSRSGTSASFLSFWIAVY